MSAMKLIDSHAHVDGAEYDGDRAEVLARARAAGVSQIVTIGTGPTLEQIARAITCAEAVRTSQEPDVVAAIGVHPHDADKVTDAWWPELDRMVRHPRVVAVGETGLDFHYDNSDRVTQAAVFRRQIQLARVVKKPVVCHIRDAHPESLAILIEENAAEVGAAIHCFTGGPAEARGYVAAGFHISFSGIITFKTAQAIRDAVREVPLDRILIETDCPYLSPIPLRGKRNEPAHLVHTAAVVAQEAGISTEELAARATANTSALFRLTAP